jgi:MraZ protein
VEENAAFTEFRGINAITIDTKGRLSIPARYRESLVHHLVVTIDTEETCLLLYPEVQWQPIQESLRKLPSFNVAARRIQRLLIGHATDVEVDSNGRILLPSVLREYAHLEKNVVMIGQGNKFEVWDEVIWESKRQQWLLEEASKAGEPPVELKDILL